MVKLSSKEVLRLKLWSIPVKELKLFCQQNNLPNNLKTTKIIEIILQQYPSIEQEIDNFIKKKYSEKIEQRKKLITDDELKRELLKVKNFNWGVIQGQLDQKIQSQYVRKIFRYQDLINEVKSVLHNDITNYVICTWFNHWTTVLIEEHISNHSRIVPTLKNIKGIDLFFEGQPFDLKITYLPRNYDPLKAIQNPIGLAKWLYEHQGEQRFGADNRIFIVLFDRKNPDNSWKLKRDFDCIFQKIDDFFNKESITLKDEIVFTYKKKTFTAVSKILLITK